MRGYAVKSKISWILLLVFTIGWLFYGVGCTLLGVSVEDRVLQFVSDINSSDRSQVYLNFHPAIFNMAGAQDVATWETQFPVAKIPYTISFLVTNDPSNVTFTITSFDLLSWNVRFVMEQLDNDWRISEMYKDPTPLPAETLIID